VRGIERVGDLNAEVEDLLDVHGAAGDGVLERLALEEFHDDEGMAVFFAGIVNRTDIGVIKGGGGLGFALEAFEGGGVAGQGFREEFKGHLALETDVVGTVHDAHTPAAEFVQDAVVGDGLADQSFIRWIRGIS
jgi:hypothetical protein